MQYLAALCTFVQTLLGCDMAVSLGVLSACPCAVQLWRQQHKWAARRTCHLLSDLPDTVRVAAPARVPLLPLLPLLLLPLLC